MDVHFHKYQGTGNDFIIIDNRQNKFPKNNTKQIRALCDRKFGIGADGFILLENATTADFAMVYYNADGNESTMCGNGGRCLVHFANTLGLFTHATSFNAIDGLHNASIKGNIVSLAMAPVTEISNLDTYSFLNTGSPHHVEIVDALDTFEVYQQGKKIRNNFYGTIGANVNFVSKVSSNTFKVRTYERGVEDETLSCGTGVTAAAIAMFERGETNQRHLFLETLGGQLEVVFEKAQEGYNSIYLIGPATPVFKGTISI